MLYSSFTSTIAILDFVAKEVLAEIKLRKFDMTLALPIICSRN